MKDQDSKNIWNTLVTERLDQITRDTDPELLAKAMEDLTQNKIGIVHPRQPDSRDWQSAWATVIRPDSRYAGLPKVWPGKEAVLAYLVSMGLGNEARKYSAF